MIARILSYLLGRDKHAADFSIAAARLRSMTPEIFQAWKQKFMKPAVTGITREVGDYFGGGMATMAKTPNFSLNASQLREMSPQQILAKIRPNAFAETVPGINRNLLFK